ncbi:MAG TPA: MraY family glycosyltransferase [bacterium]|nr:MraY family glycosyltransferase [bacterium]
MNASGYGLVLLSAAAGGVLGTIAARALAPRLGLVDRPSSRKTQSSPVPLAGGPGIAAGLAAGIWAAGRFLPALEPIPLLPLVAGALALFLLGSFDDRRPLGPRVKLALQTAICGAAAVAGLAPSSVPGPEGPIALGLAAVPLTTLWLVGMLNAINLIDGLDGLAGGITLLAFISLATVAPGPGFLVTAAAIVIGAVAGFLPFNLATRRAFLGDGGSLLLGFLLAAVPLVAVGRGSWAPGIVALACAAVPVLDTAVTIARRRRGGAPVFRPDAWHIHHRLLWLGLGPRGALLALLGLCGGGGLLALGGLTGRAGLALAGAALIGAATLGAVRAGRRGEAGALSRVALVFLARRPRRAARRVARGLRPVRGSHAA